MADIRAEYEELRKEYLASQKDRSFVTLAKARSKKQRVDWTKINITKPSFLGTRVFADFDLNQVLPYIDWDPFFATWQIRGKYPNRTYPKIFNDKTVGQEAQKLFENAQAMLKQLIDQKLVEARGIVGFYPCNQVDEDDIQVFCPDTGASLAKFFTLRQQLDLDQDNFVAMSDFVAPLDQGVKDYIGAFAVSAGFKQDELCKKYIQDGDDYNNIMVKTLTDRLAEAFAEYMHVLVRQELWGYSPRENLSTADILNVKYQGIRPAPGYPSQPDHTEKQTMWKLMDIEAKTGIRLTESLAMTPASSVSGLYFANPHAHYFAVQEICTDQVEDYSRRKQQLKEVTERWLAPVLGYNP